MAPPGVGRKETLLPGRHAQGPVGWPGRPSPWAQRSHLARAASPAAWT